VVVPFPPVEPDMMHRFLVRLPAVSAVALLAACADGIPVAPLAPSAAAPVLAKGAAATAGRYLVGLTDGAALAPETLAASGGAIVDSIPAFGVVVVDGVTNPSALLEGGAAYVEPEFETTLDVARFDEEEAQAAPEALTAPWYASGVQWDMKAIHADQTWATSNAGEGATVCIVDSGVDELHQELSGGKVLLRANFVTAPAAETDPTFHDDRNGHGSHVAGTVAARGTVMSGVAPRANILAARVLNTAGSGSETAIVNGIRWCADNGAHVINASLGGIRYRGTAGFVTSPITYGNAVRYATDRGVVVVLAAGNSNLRLPNPGGALSVMPAQVPGALMVGATGPVSKVGTFQVDGATRTLPLPVPGWNPFDPEQVWQGVDGKAFYSNYGTAVHVFAPGGRGPLSLMYPHYRHNQLTQGSTLDQIYSLCSSKTTQTGAQDVGGAPGAAGSCANATGRYIAYAGTSMAAPHVAGLAAVLYAEIGGAPTAEGRARVMECIQRTTDDIGPATTFGGGRINAKRAVDAVRAGEC
jgi:subtilisin family serine protease